MIQDFPCSQRDHGPRSDEDTFTRQGRRSSDPRPLASSKLRNSLPAIPACSRLALMLSQQDSSPPKEEGGAVGRGDRHCVTIPASPWRPFGTAPSAAFQMPCPRPLDSTCTQSVRRPEACRTRIGALRRIDPVVQGKHSFVSLMHAIYFCETEWSCVDKKRRGGWEVRDS